MLLVVLGGMMIAGVNPFLRLASVRAPGANGPVSQAYVYGVFLGPIALPCAGPFLIATLAISVVWAKPALSNGSLLWATTFRQVVTFFVMAPVALALPDRRAIWGVFKPRDDWRFMLPATTLGSFFALLLWLGGMKYTEAGSAAIINQTSTVFILVLASIFLKEPFTARRWAAAGLAIAGILLVTFG